MIDEFRLYYQRLKSEYFDLVYEDKIAAAIQQLSNLRQGLRDICDLVNVQAEDEGIWFEAQTAPEGYLQQELRKLHALIEDVAERNDLK